MKKAIRQGVCLVLALMLAVGICLPASAAISGTELQKAVDGSAAYMLDAVKSPQVGSIGGEWAVIGLARSGYQVPQSYWDGYYRTVEEYVKARKGVLHEKKYTEYSRVIVALSSIGADARNVAGYDLVKPLGDYDKTVWQGINGPIWALIALDSGNYEVPENPEAATQATRQMYIDRLLDSQLSDGGWNLFSGTSAAGSGGRSDPDITGMALQALARYQDQPEVARATREALDCVSGMQDADGGYSSWNSTNSESVVQVIVALCELGIPLDDARFVKNGRTMLDNLMGFRQENGGFLHTASGSGSNQMASEQGLYGLVAAQRAAEGRSSLYRMDDVTIHVTGGGDDPSGLPGKNPDVKKVPVVEPGKTFSDISGENAHADQAAIEALAVRGILNGKGGGLFDPDGDMTRAEFAAVAVRGLGLTPRENGKFSDVASGRWFAPFVGTANAYGVVNGVSDTAFHPDGTVTRQEAAVMVARAAALCGMDTEMDPDTVRDTLAQFSDYVKVPEWARPGVAFCYQAGILDDSALEIRGAAAIRRCEAAQMIFRLLGASNLL